MWPNVPPNLANTLNGTRSYERIHEILELTPVDQRLRQAGSGQSLKHLAAHRSQPRVIALPEWRTGRQRQELWDAAGECIKNRHRLFRAVHADMHMQPEDHQPLRRPLHTLHQFAVTILLGNGLLGPSREGVGARRDHVAAKVIANRSNLRHDRLKVTLHLLDIGAHAGIELNGRLQQLRFHVRVAFQRTQHIGAQWGQLTC